MKHTFLLLLFSFLAASTFTQVTDLSIGQWKSHLPFPGGLDVTQSNDRVYYATELAILAFDKDDDSIERMTKVEGLSNVGIRAIKYNRLSDILMVVYNNGIIDLLDENGILTIFSIQESDIIIGEKIVYDIFMANDSIAYLAANYGITRMNLKTGKTPATIKTPLAVKSVAIYNNALYAGTDYGLYEGKLDGSINEEDFNNWTYLDEEKGFPIDYSSNSMVTFNEKLFLEVNDTLFSFDGNTLNFEYFIENQTLNFISAEGTNLLAGFDHPNDEILNRIITLSPDGTFSESPAFCALNIQYALEDENGKLWIANDWREFRSLDPGSGSCSKLIINSPYDKNVSEIAVGDGQVWVAAGGVEPNNFTALELPDGFFSLIDGEWFIYNKFEEPFRSSGGLWDDFYTIEIHPDNSKVYAGSFLGGLAVFDNATQEISLYNDMNSSMTNAVGDISRTRVTGLTFDDEDNLWISNHTGSRPLSVWRNDGTWENFDPPCTNDNTFMDIAIDAFGYKWIRLSNSTQAVLVYDEVENRCKVLNTANTEALPSNEVRSLEADLDGNIWVGTKLGPVVFECSVLDSDCPGSRRIVDQDGFGAYLLENEDILCIAVDGANRKWFGTTNGIFVQSPSGEEQIARFTTSNSPLFDNTIRDLAFDHQTGEVYIGTNVGLQVFRSDATLGTDFHTNVVVYPNPVRPEYNGPIAIKGLAQDANVKITDVSGQLVFETTALGGQAIWDGRDYNGRKANSGVYLIFSTSDSSTNPNTEVAKLLLMN